MEKRKLRLDQLSGFLELNWKKYDLFDLYFTNKSGETVAHYSNIGNNMYLNLIDIKHKNDYLNYTITESFNSQEGKNALIRIPIALENKSNVRIGYLLGSIQLSSNFHSFYQLLDEALAKYFYVTSYKNEFARAYVFLYLILAVPVLLLVLIFSIFLSREITEPINELSNSTRKIASGDLTYHIESTFKDEFQDVIDSFNMMVRELHFSRNKLKQAERISTWQEIARRLAHEIKNPLTPIKLSIQRIQRKYEQNDYSFPGVLKQGAKTILEEVDNMTEMINEFSNFAKLPTVQKTKGGLNNLITNVANLFKELDLGINIDIVLPQQDFEFLRDEKQLKRVYVNLVQNAISASAKNGKIEIGWDLINIGFSNYIRSWIRDWGNGINDKDKDKIFEPYYTTKIDGVGLGLAIVQKIVHDHQGQIFFESRTDQGTTFYVDLPYLQE